MANLFGRVLIISGVILFLIGIMLVFHVKIPYIGKLPGDIYIKKENFTFYFPLMSSIIFSILFSFILWLFSKK
ncbi:MAG: hypothetical protein A2539_01855 [Elusimicrobia bacterium RIFOXYD2_FULL_34_15]|nr:MAG: hypothetical protein A2539_01855 [Elusimicrobia bacterium RIFOXYD2_FULL_34_15]